MDSSGVYHLGAVAMKRLLVGIFAIVILSAIIGGLIVYEPKKATTPTNVVAPLPTCVWVREAHQVPKEEGPTNVMYNCWSSLDGAWEGYVEEQQSGDWFDAHSPDPKTDEHAAQYDTYGTLAQAEAAVERKWHAKVNQ